MTTPRTGTTFRDRTVLVTGASSGIGRETALAFAAAGANLVLVARRAKALASVAAQARKFGAETLVAAADVTQPEAVTACFRKAVKRFGSVDVVYQDGLPDCGSQLMPGRTADRPSRLRTSPHTRPARSAPQAGPPSHPGSARTSASTGLPCLAALLSSGHPCAR